jgi:hypothetical protein
VVEEGVFEGEGIEGDCVEERKALGEVRESEARGSGVCGEGLGVEVLGEEGCGESGAEVEGGAEDLEGLPEEEAGDIVHVGGLECLDEGEDQFDSLEGGEVLGQGGEVEDGGVGGKEFGEEEVLVGDDEEGGLGAVGALEEVEEGECGGGNGGVGEGGDEEEVGIVWLEGGEEGAPDAHEA